MDNNVTHLPVYQRETTARRVIPGQQRPEFRPSSAASPRPEAPKRFVAKGHDAQLQDAQHNKHKVEITTMAGEVIAGTVSRRDKFTITLQLTGGNDAGCDLIIYKHAIESVLVRKPAQSQEV